jgi:hypothetical protein
MNLHSFRFQPPVALGACILILVHPSLPNFIVAIYLIIFAVVGRAPRFLQRAAPTTRSRAAPRRNRAPYPAHGTDDTP